MIKSKAIANNIDTYYSYYVNIILFSLIVIIIWLLITYSQSVYNASVNKNLELPDNTPRNIKILDNTQLLKFYHDVVEDYKECEMFSIAGTALGCIRHNNIIPWDDDIDLGLDRSKIPLFLEISKNKGYNIKLVWFGYKIYDRKGDYFIDVFIFTEIEGKYHYGSKKARIAWPKEYFLSKEEVFPLIYRKFSNYNIPTPKNLKEYCDRAYKNWDKTVIYQIPHRSFFFERYFMKINPFIPKKWKLNI